MFYASTDQADEVEPVWDWLPISIEIKRMQHSKVFHSKSLLTQATKGATYTPQEFLLLLFTLALIVVLLSPLALAHRVVRNYQPGVETRVYIQLNKCHDIDRGQYVCNDVRFVPQVFRAK